MTLMVVVGKEEEEGVEGGGARDMRVLFDALIFFGRLRRWNKSSRGNGKIGVICLAFYPFPSKKIR